MTYKRLFFIACIRKNNEWSDFLWIIMSCRLFFLKKSLNYVEALVRLLSFTLGLGCAEIKCKSGRNTSLNQGYIRLFRRLNIILPTI